MLSTDPRLEPDRIYKKIRVIKNTAGPIKNLVATR